MISNDLNTVLPELLLAIYAMGALMFAVYTGKDRMASMLIWITALVMFALGGWIAVQPAGAHTAFNGAFVDDEFSPLCQGSDALGQWSGVVAVA